MSPERTAESEDRDARKDQEGQRGEQGDSEQQNPSPSEGETDQQDGSGSGGQGDGGATGGPDQDTGSETGTFEVAGIKLPIDGLEVLKVGGGKFAKDGSTPPGDPEDTPEAPEPSEGDTETAPEESPEPEGSEASGEVAADEKADPPAESAPAPAPENAEEGPDAAVEPESQPEEQEEAEVPEPPAPEEAEEFEAPAQGKQPPQTDRTEGVSGGVADRSGGLIRAGAVVSILVIRRLRRLSKAQALLLSNGVVLMGLVVVLLWGRPWGAQEVMAVQRLPMQQVAPLEERDQEGARFGPPPWERSANEERWRDEPTSLDYEHAYEQKPEVPTGVSWSETERAFFGQDYRRAIFAYEALLKQSDAHPDNRLISDFLRFRIAQCLMRLAQRKEARAMYLRLGNSRSPIIRAVTQYELATDDLLNGQFIRARTRAYQGITDLAALAMPLALEADCDFLIARALTQKAFEYYGRPHPIKWEPLQMTDPFASLSESDLRKLLRRGVGILDRSVLGPSVQRVESETGGRRFAASCTRTAIEEFLTVLAGRTETDLQWKSVAPPVRRRMVSIHYSQVSQHRLGEVACGAVGLLARFTGDKMLVYNPMFYKTLSDQKALITAEGTSAWSRWFLRYPEGERSGEGHLGLALLEEYSGNQMAALREFQVVAQTFEKQRAAAEALLRSAMIRIRLRDYAGARLDLLNLLDRYPDHPSLDKVYLYLGNATMKAGLLADAIAVFRKLYYMNLAAESRAQASLGAARCFWKNGDFENTHQWATRHIGLVNPPDEDLSESYTLLARSEAAQGNYEESLAAYYHALAAQPSPSRRVDVILGLADTQIRREKFAEAVFAMNRLRGTELSPERTHQCVLKSTEVYRAIGLSDRAIPTLRKHLRQTDDPTMRARLSVSLANCYADEGKLDTAAEVLTAILEEVTGGGPWHEVTARLAEICVELNRTDQAIMLGEGLLRSPCSSEIRKRAQDVLGSAYVSQRRYDQAVMVLSGLAFEDVGDETVQSTSEGYSPSDLKGPEQ